MAHSALFSSQSDLWGTPTALFNMLNEIYSFQLDPAATTQNRLCEHYFTAEQNGLAQDWYPYRRIWLNPPYGKTIGAWMAKAYSEAQKGCLVVCLVPARVDTRWWHDWVHTKAQVTFFKGRLKYRRLQQTGAPAKYGAPFPSALVIYAPDLENHKRLHYSQAGTDRADASLFAEF